METSQFVLQSKSNAIKLKKKLELFQMSQKKKAIQNPKYKHSFKLN